MEATLEDSREFDLEANTQRTKYMFISCHQNTEQNHNLLIL
jgi:hypothetical protein